VEKQLIENVAPNSCELSTNAKGKVQVTLKVYHEDPKEAAIKAMNVLDFLKTALGDRAASG
jgi:hypothetical protein